MYNDTKAADAGRIRNSEPQSMELSAALAQARKANEAGKRVLAECDSWFSKLLHKP